MLNSPNVLEISSLHKAYGETKVLKNLSLVLPVNQSLVIAGLSGCGKTTLLRLIAGLESPDQGEIFINGKLVSNREWTLPPYRRRLGFVFQSPALWPHMTVEEHLGFSLRERDKEKRKAIVSRIMQETAIGHLKDRYPDGLSGGEARRVALARALSANPELMLMDEPLTNLDTDLKEMLLQLIITRVLKQKISLIYVTHDLQEADRIAAPVLQLTGGELKD